LLIVQHILLLMEGHIDHIFSQSYLRTHHSPFWWGKWNICTTSKNS